MKRLLIILSFFGVLPIGMQMAPATMQAADKQNTLLILTKDNCIHQFVLADKPQVTFEGTQLKVTSSKTTAAFELSDVIRFTYEGKDASGIDEMTIDPAEISMEGGMLVISQLKANATVNIYAFDGKLVQQLTARHAGTYRLSLSLLPAGVYLVKADNITYKITKR